MLFLLAQAALSLTIQAGGTTTLSTTSDFSVTPVARISVDAPTSDFEYTPRLFVRGDLTALPGQTVDLSDVSSFNALEFSVGLAQPLPKTKFGLYGVFGFATRLEGDTTPLVRSPKFASAGLLFVTKNREHHLAVGMGGDQRLSSQGYWQTCLHIDGQVAIFVKDKVKVSLTISSILGMTSSDRSDLVRVGVVIGI